MPLSMKKSHLKFFLYHKWYCFLNLWRKRERGAIIFELYLLKHWHSPWRECTKRWTFQTFNEPKYSLSWGFPKLKMQEINSYCHKQNDMPSLCKSDWLAIIANDGKQFSIYKIHYAAYLRQKQKNKKQEKS